jgi:serine/threonine protein kinase/Tfp pilus assembly protein PilF
MSTQNLAADRNLLFGILALQMDFIGRDDLIAALNAWVLAKSKSLGQILQEQGKLAPPRLQLLEALVGEHLQAHHGDPQQSLVVLSAVSAVRQALHEVADADVQASLARVPVANAPQAEGTVSYQALDAGAPGLRYRVLRPHASGGLGEVFVAEDTELHREVALKEIRKEHAENTDSRGRFVRKAEITGGLEHPGIVPIYGLGQYEDGRPFYAMRFIQGDNLKEAIQRFHQQSPQRERGPTLATPSERNVAFRELLGRFVDVCNAVAYAHSRGILHRDLKPGNVMLGKYGETLVVDWGLAKPLGRVEGSLDSGEATLRLNSANGDLAATRLGSAVGTPAFMSPEQAAGRLDRLGPATDIYSLGATLYAVLTGQPPFTGDIGEVLRQVQRGDFPPPRQVKADISPALEAICLKAMAKDPEERYRTALQLAEDVEHWLADEPVSAWPEPLRIRVGRWARQHRPLVAGVAAALLVGLLALGTGAVWYQHQEAQRFAEQVRQEELARKEVDRAAEFLAGLHKQLARNGGVRQLLNEPARWQGQLQQAQLYLDKAQALRERAGESLDPALTDRLQVLQLQLTQGRADRQLAEQMEKIRLDWSAQVDGRLDFAAAERQYPKAFADAGLDVAQGQLPQIASRIRKSAIQEQLVAALDNWAFVAWHENHRPLQARLLQLARLADPDPWRNQVRDPAAWTDPQTAKALTDTLVAKKIALGEFSPQMLESLGQLLLSAKGDAAGWLRQALAHHPSDFWLNFDLANILAKDRPSDAAGYYRAALAVRPQSTVAWYNLGNGLVAQKDLPGAVDAFRKALTIDPRDTKILVNLGAALHDQKDCPGAMDAYRKALTINPRDAMAWYNLAITLSEQKDVPGAVDAYRKALAFKPRYAHAWVNLGTLLYSQQDPKGAGAAFQKALDIDPRYTLAWYNLGNVLSAQKDLPGAIQAYQKALQIDPQLAQAHGALGRALLERGEFAQAHKATLRALQLLPANHPLRGTAQKQIQRCEQALQQEQRALDVVQGKAPPDDATALLQLAQFCHRYHRPATATRLYASAFTDQPSLAEDVRQGLRFQAACAATLAAAGRGLDASKVSDQDRSELRRQALAWLRADLMRLTQTMADYQAAAQPTPPASPLGKLLAPSPEFGAAALLLACDRWQYWQQNPALMSVRDDKALAKLPVAEQKDWRKLWSEVRALDKQVRASFSEKQLTGNRTVQQKEQVHPVQLQAGQTYIFDLESSDFDPVLRLEDAQGQKLAENDDIEPGVIRNSRILFTPKASARYRLVATAVQVQGTGAYVLRIRELAGPRKQAGGPGSK